MGLKNQYQVTQRPKDRCTGMETFLDRICEPWEHQHLEWMAVLGKEEGLLASLSSTTRCQ